MEYAMIVIGAIAPARHDELGREGRTLTSAIARTHKQFVTTK